MKTGVFFHNEFRNKDWPIIGDKFRNFPDVMKKPLSMKQTVPCRGNGIVSVPLRFIIDHSFPN